MKQWPSAHDSRLKSRKATASGTTCAAATARVLTFDDEAAARAKLMELYPVLVQMERYGDGKRTRVLRILVDEDDWPQRKKGA